MRSALFVEERLSPRRFGFFNLGQAGENLRTIPPTRLDSKREPYYWSFLGAFPDPGPLVLGSEGNKHANSIEMNVGPKNDPSGSFFVLEGGLGWEPSSFQPPDRSTA